MLSVQEQIDSDWEQIFIVDEKRHGVILANEQLDVQKDHIRGEWIFILDDDCRLIEPTFVARLKQETKKDVVMVKSRRPQLAPMLLPPPKIWGSKSAMFERANKTAVLNCLCYVVCQSMWKQHIHAFSGSIVGAWTFPASFLPGAKLTWFDLVVAETLQLGRGTAFECGSPWWIEFATQHQLQRLSVTVWRRRG